MSDITLRLAEACERLAKLASERAPGKRYTATCVVTPPEWADQLRAEADLLDSDAIHLRALAAALRGATEVSSLDGTRIVNVVISLGDA